MHVGVVISRFQVPKLHDAHKETIKRALAKCDRLVVFLGVSPTDGQTHTNPLTFSQRREMLLREFSELPVYPLLDKPTAADWIHQLESTLESLYPTAKRITVFRGRTEDAETFQKHYTSVTGIYSIESLDIDMPDVSGTKVREEISESSSREFLRGQIYARQTQHPRAYLTVDIAFTHDDKVALIRRRDNGDLCFPGGFVESTDRSLEWAAKRELREETGAESEHEPVFIASRRIEDWRYRNTHDCIMTTFWEIPYTWGSTQLQGNPAEVSAIEWHEITGALLDKVVHYHRDLAHDLVTYRLRNRDVKDGEYAL